ncbi:MAG: hypothetical protein ACIAQ0_05575 [Phycisphaerales bacterium JB058]
MSPLRRLLETVHLTFVGLWMGSLAMAGAAAAIIFPTVRDLDPSLPAYAAFTGPHWKLAAGHVASRIFLVADAVALGCLIVSGLTLGLVAASKEPWRQAWTTGVRLVAFFGALSLLTYSFVFLGPRMNTNMVNYWEAAEAGNNEAALEYQAAFDKDHPTASTVMVSSFACVTLLMISGAFAATARTATPAQPSGASKPTLEQPSLTRKGRL